MTTRITRIEGERASEMVLKLEGVVTVADAKLLEEICEDLRRFRWATCKCMGARTELVFIN